MYYEIVLNGLSLGVVGHPNVANMHLSLLITDDGPAIFASAVCGEADGNYLYEWMQRRVSPTDIVEFRPAIGGPSLPPEAKRKMTGAPE
jgi:hypothetical protein